MLKYTYEHEDELFEFSGGVVDGMTRLWEQMARADQDKFLVWFDKAEPPKTTSNPSGGVWGIANTPPPTPYPEPYIPYPEPVSLSEAWASAAQNISVAATTAQVRDIYNRMMTNAQATGRTIMESTPEVSQTPAGDLSFELESPF